MSYTFKMIIEKRLSAKIDESDGFIYFEKHNDNLLTFDKQIQNFCSKVTQLADYIKKNN
jgi:hypothetical protein